MRQTKRSETERRRKCSTLGPTCSQTNNACAALPVPCRNGGTCVNTASGFVCQCNAFFQGSDCSIPIDPCSSNPCVASNTISCQIVANVTSFGYSCTCRSGFTGKAKDYQWEKMIRDNFRLGARCEISFSPCDSSPCSFGRCVAATPNAWTCVCEPGWTGIQCKDGINECLSNPCLNAGVCIDGINEYRCICLTGYTGVNCQLSINPCLSIPCKNNGNESRQ